MSLEKRDGVTLPESKRIAVVDDDRSILEFMSIFLGGEGYCVHEFPTGVEALPVLKRRKPDLLIVDYCLPEMNGLELVDALDCHYRLIASSSGQVYKPFPVMLFTALFNGNPNDEIKKFRAKGRGRIFGKPFNIVNFAEAVSLSLDNNETKANP